jgi:hypothetical protein
VTRLTPRWVRIISLALLITAIYASDASEVTVQDFLKASSVEDLTRKNPEFRKNPSFVHFAVLEDHKKILNAILNEDLKSLSDFFSDNVHIEINEVYYENFKMTKVEKKEFQNKRSILYKFIFDHDAAMKAMPSVMAARVKFHSVKYCINYGVLYFASKALLDFSLRDKNRDGVSIRMKCAKEKCRISGFVNNGYGAGLDK